MTTASPSVGAFQLSALGAQAGNIAVPATQQEDTAVAIAPDDSTVVTVGGSQMNIASIGGPSYVTPTGTSPSRTVTLDGTANGLAISPDGQFAYSVVSLDNGPTLEKVALQGAAAPVEFPLRDQNFPSMLTIALSPDGGTAYLGGDFSCGGTGSCAIVDSMSTSTGATLHASPNDGAVGQVNSIAVTPNGQEVYASGSFGTEVLAPDLGVTSGVIPTGNSKSVAVTPDGSEVYVGCAGAAKAVIWHFAVTAAGSAKPSPLAVPAIPVEARRSGVVAVAISPDSSDLIATTVAIGPAGTSPDLLSVPLAGDNPTGTPVDNPGSGTARYLAIAITPDLAPVARLSALPSNPVAGHSATIDASASSVPFGSISGFVWTAPAGASCPPSAGPTLSCTFPTAGNYTVGLREADTAGTSTVGALQPAVGGVDYGGQTAYRVANNAAATSFLVRVATTSGGTIPISGPTTTAPTAPGAATSALVLNPTVGPPGCIVTVTGSGFTPNAPVTVSWSVSSGSVVITADGSGNLPPTALPILVPAVLGPRSARASSTPPAQASFLVVASSSEPGGDQGSMMFRSEGP